MRKREKAKPYAYKEYSQRRKKTIGVESPKKRNVKIYKGLLRIRKKSPELTILCLVFFRLRTKLQREARLFSDLGLIISNKIYVSSKTEDQKQRKYEQRDIKKLL